MEDVRRMGALRPQSEVTAMTSAQPRPRDGIGKLKGRRHRFVELRAALKA